MPAKWTKSEAGAKKEELIDLYVKKNLSLREIALILKRTQSGIFKRLRILHIRTNPTRKNKYLNKNRNVYTPKRHSGNLAELFGILLGDGHISRFQTIVTLGNKEFEYALYIAQLFKKVVGQEGTILRVKGGYYNVVINSKDLATWFISQGLTSNKVQNQVAAPSWIINNPKYAKRFLRGFFDTDGSVYKLKFGIQASFCNYSLPLLKSTRNMLVSLGYKVSEISRYNLYITKRSEVTKFFSNIKPKNTKHVLRYGMLTKICVDGGVVNRNRL